MIGLVCMFDGKGMKNGIRSIQHFNLEKLKEATLFNLDYNIECIKFCIKNNFIFRVSSSIIPYSDMWNWDEDKDILKKMKEIKILSKDIRLIVHPDQFVVLNSEKESVVSNSIKILEEQAKISKYLGIRNMIIHLGRKNASEDFLINFKKLSKNVTEILALENCHYYRVDEILKVCQILKLPMVLDVHHARITNSFDFDLDGIKKTWKDSKPLAHISSGKAFETDKSHSDYISEEDLKKYRWLFDEFDVEIEAKKKEKAVLKVKDFLENNT